MGDQAANLRAPTTGLRPVSRYRDSGQEAAPAQRARALGHRGLATGNLACSRLGKELDPPLQGARWRPATTGDFSLRELHLGAGVEDHIRRRIEEEVASSAFSRQRHRGGTGEEEEEEPDFAGQHMEPITQHMRHVSLGQGQQDQAAAAARDGAVTNAQEASAAVEGAAAATDAAAANEDSSQGSRPGASMGKGSDGQTVSYNAERIIGNGSFGVVFQATVVETGQVVAIKKVLQDKRFKNRELQIMRMLAKQTHPNIVHLKHCFYSNGEKADELYLNLVLEYVPETVYSMARQYQKSKQTLPTLLIKLYMYQLSRALAHIHALGICHRDIKPQNLLLDPATHVLKLCDFGSAKILVRGEPNVSYICSRYYRAPELIFGSTDYSCKIDTWSLGCVGAELLLGQPLFPGESGVDQLLMHAPNCFLMVGSILLLQVLGTPTRGEIRAMNSNYTEFKFPQIKAHPWAEVFRSKTPPEAIEVVAGMLAYDPECRTSPLQTCRHSFFDELRDPRVKLPSGGDLPSDLLDFTALELSACPELAELAPAKGSEGAA
ncbi:unnamed protein product [Chrysoparadoxa australica]